MVFWCSDTALQEVGKVSKRTRASWQVATSNKCCAVQVRGKRGGDRKGSQVQSKKPKKGSEKGGAVSANVASERSTKQEVSSKNGEARVNERQKVTFGTLGYGPRARYSLPWCFGALTRLSKRWAKSPREHGQAGRWPIKGGRSPSLELVSREFRKQRLAPWAASPGPCGEGAVCEAFGDWKTAQTASFLVGSESNVRQWGPRPAGPVRPSGPLLFWCGGGAVSEAFGDWKTAQTASFPVGSESNRKQR